MTAKGKVLVSIGRVFEDENDGAGALPNPHLLIADGLVETVEESDMCIVELRMVMPARSAAAMLLGMLEGETEIAFTGMSPVVGI
jgi:hypothetical protein